MYPWDDERGPFSEAWKKKQRGNSVIDPSRIEIYTSKLREFNKFENLCFILMQNSIENSFNKFKNLYAHTLMQNSLLLFIVCKSNQTWAWVIMIKGSKTLRDQIFRSGSKTIIIDLEIWFNWPYEIKKYYLYLLVNSYFYERNAEKFGNKIKFQKWTES